MPRKGGKPKPTRLKKLEGNPGKRPLNEFEPTPKQELLECPSHLTGEAKAEWKRMAPKLYRLGLLSEIDGAAFAAYCQSYALWVEASIKLKDGSYIVLVNGYPQQNPYLSVMNKAIKEMKAFMTEFGMTPSSRSRISAVPPPPSSKAEKMAQDDTPDWDNMFTAATFDDSKSH